MSPSGPAVLVMARAPRLGETRRALEPMLGVEGCRTLQAVLLAQTVRWASLLQPREVCVAYEPADAGDELRELVGVGATVFPQNGEGIVGRVADAAGRVSARSPGPLVIVWPDLPQLRPMHAEGVLGDLAAGCDVVFGPVFDGGFYLIGVARPTPALFAVPERAWRSSDGLGEALAVVADARLEVGLLRAERALHRPADVRAALADPSLPVDVARALGRRG